MNVVLDTNTVISAGLTPHGVSAKVFQIVIDSEEIRLYYNQEIYEEYAEVIARPHLKISFSTQQLFLDAVKSFGVLITPPVSTIPLPDESDRKFYDTAKECGAVLVTGNLKHYPPEDFIMNSAQFLQKYQADRME